MDAIDSKIKAYLEKQSLLQSGRSRTSLSADDLYRFIMNELEGRELERVIHHLKSDPEDRELVRRARRLMEDEPASETQAVPTSLVQRAKKLSPNPFSRKQRLNTALFAAGAASFALSFADSRHFIQWVALAFFLCLKATLDRRALKTQILIYKTLQDDTQAASDHLHRPSSRL